MKIAFLCGCLEPGHDGVGDYTRRLGGELMNRGHDVVAAAMYDRYVDTLTEQAQVIDGFSLPVMRIPVTWSDDKRFLRVKEWIDKMKPFWLSLQFVPYAFHAKGLPFGFLQHIASWKKRCHWHIMFHELWLGSPKGIKQRVISHAQQFVIKRLIAKLRPEVINVSIPHYQACLNGKGANSTVLGLFGNIAIGENDEAFNRISGRDPFAKNILYFGNAPRDGFLHKLVKELQLFCSSHSHPVNIIVVSGNSAHKDQFVRLLNDNLEETGANVIDFGFVNGDALSTLMRKCTVGIARSRPHMLGKSGSAIAMLEHGLPVWLPQWDSGSILQFDFRKHLIYRDLYKAASVPSREDYHSLLPDVTEKFLSQLDLV